LIDLSSTATHYDLRAVALEAFARPLWGLACLCLGGDEYSGLDRWVRGLASGTDPEGEEYWGGAKAKDQRMVEMSPLSFAIAMAPERFYEVSDPYHAFGILTLPSLNQTRPSETLRLSWKRV
jgi:hypothetical protein